MELESSASPRHQGMTRGIHTLPVELLEKIFYMLIYDGLEKYSGTSHAVYIVASLESDRLSISQVCSWWRTVVLGDPRLWAVIFTPTSQSGMNWVRVCLARSGNADLVICVAPSRPDEWLAESKKAASLMGTIEDDINRVQRLLFIMPPGYSSDLAVGCMTAVIESAMRPRQLFLRRSLEGLAPRRNAVAMALFMSKVRDLEIDDRDFPRETLFDLLRLPRELRRLRIDFASVGIRHCRTGQAIYPQITLPDLEVLEITRAALPALSFIAPKLAHLKVMFNLGRGLPNWWYTNSYQIQTPSHHEVIHSPQFPVLQSLSVNATINNHDFLEPQAILIRAHPAVATLKIVGFPGAEALTRRAFGDDELGVLASGATSPRTPSPPSPSDSSLSPIKPPSGLQRLTFDLRDPRDKNWAEPPVNPQSFLDLVRSLLLAAPHLCITILLQRAMVTKFDPDTKTDTTVKTAWLDGLKALEEEFPDRRRWRVDFHEADDAGNEWI